MDGRQVVLMLLLGAAVCGFASCRLTSVESMAHSHYKAITESLIVAHEPWAEHIHDLDKGALLGFSYTNCADAKDETLVPSNMSIRPDPIKLPGNVILSGSAAIKRNITSPVKADLKVYTEVFHEWVKVPCVDKLGSCTYDDICKMIKLKECPAPLLKAGLGCKCPFPAGNFNVDPMTLRVGIKLPVSGAIKVRAKLTQENQLITCAELVLRIA